MKIRNLTLTLLGMVLICAGMASCGKDDPKPTDPDNNALNNLVKYGYRDEMPKIVERKVGLKFCFEGYDGSNTMTWPSFGLSYRETLNKKNLTYKLYKVFDGNLTETGKTKQFSVMDVINILFGNFVFYENHDLDIVSCIFPVSATYSSALKLTYKFEYPNILIDYSNLPAENYNPVLSLRPWIESPEDYCIIAFENEDVRQAILKALELIKQNNSKPVKFEAWRLPGFNNNTPYATFFPDERWCYDFIKECLVPLTNKLNPDHQITMSKDFYPDFNDGGVAGYNTRFVFSPLYTCIPN